MLCDALVDEGYAISNESDIFDWGSGSATSSQQIKNIKTCDLIVVMIDTIQPENKQKGKKWTPKATIACPAKGWQLNIPGVRVGYRLGFCAKTTVIINVIQQWFDA